MQKKDVISRIEKSGIEFLRVLWCDNAGIIRSKAIHVSILPDNFDYPVGISEAQQSVPVMYDGVSEGAGLGPVGEVYLKPDWNSFVFLPYNHIFAAVPSDMYKNGAPWPCCPRNFLKKAVSEASKKFEFEINAAFENEFYLFNNTDFNNDKLVPVDDSLFAMASAMDACPQVIDEITKSLRHQNMGVERYYPESGPGQQEISIKYANALTAADNQILFRQTITGVAQKHNMTASFMPKIFENTAGSGCHLHLSLFKNSKNISGSNNNPTKLSDTMQYFMAGILKHLPALCAVTVPSVNSYRRIQPHFWSGAYSCWGYDNREAALRVITAPDGKSVSHIELKTSDAAANPYLALGAVIYAGLDGINNKMRLNEPVAVDPGNLSEKELQDNGIKRLPLNLGAALEELRNDDILKNAFGKELFEAYTAVKNNEWNSMKDYTIELERKMLLKRF
ncbi:MAG: glutamine synthetase family protein [Candidatus Wallbacteria bacterium]